MSSKFPTLALEVIELITSFVELADLRSLRLVCRKLCRKTINTFGRANFTTLQTDLSRQSLERIQNVSKSGFAVHGKFLSIKESLEGILGQGLDWPRHSSGCLAENLNINLLRDALSQRLLNCRSFLIDSYDEYKPRHDTDRLVSSDAVGLILSIIAEADLAVHSFTVQSIHFGQGRLDTPRLQMPITQTPNFGKAWSQIEELVLDYAITSDQYSSMLHLISLAPRVRKLSLGFFEADASFVQRLSSSHQLNRLEELRLQGAMVTVDTVTSLLLQNRDTLHSLSLQFTALHDEDKWSTVF